MYSMNFSRIWRYSSNLWRETATTTNKTSNMETLTEKLHLLIVEAQEEIEEYLARNAMDVMQIGGHLYTRDAADRIVFVNGNNFYDVRVDIEGLIEDADIAAMENAKPRQRDVSYGELAALQEIFEEQAKEWVFDEEETRQECLLDFQQQYIDGDDNPQIRDAGYGMHRK